MHQSNISGLKAERAPLPLREGDGGRGDAIDIAGTAMPLPRYLPPTTAGEAQTPCS